MADRQGDGAIAPRRSLGGPILPPPPPEMAEEAKKHEEQQAAARKADARRQAEKEARQAQKDAKRDAAAKRHEESRRRGEAKRSEAKRAEEQRAQSRRAAPVRTDADRSPASSPARSSSGATGSITPGSKSSSTSRARSARRTRRAQLRLVQVDAWSVMKTSFLLSIALGIVLVVAVAIIWSVLGAAGVWDSINSIVQQAVGTDNGTQFDIEQYLGASRVLGFTMIVAVLDVILITAIATLGAFLYNLSAALLGGIEVTLAEDS